MKKKEFLISSLCDENLVDVKKKLYKHSLLLYQVNLDEEK